MNCALCQNARPRRFCPAVNGNICSVCCGKEREMSLTCPLDCEYLRQARLQEQQKRVPLSPEQYPNQDIRLSESLIRENAPLLAFVAYSMGSAALRTQGITDFDVREALESLVRTYRTLQSGVYYESRPANPLAGAVYQAAQDAVEKFQKTEQEGFGISRTRTAGILAVFAFLQRMGVDSDNGRTRCRALIETLLSFYQDEFAGTETGVSAEPSSLIIP